MSFLGHNLPNDIVHQRGPRDLLVGEPLVINAQTGIFSQLIVGTGVFNNIFTDVLTAISGNITDLVVTNLTATTIVNSGVNGVFTDLLVTDTANLPAFNTLNVNATGVSNLATILTGTWNADVITETYGGTGQSGYSPGDMLYADGAGNLTVLPSGAEGQVLTIQSGALAWV